MEFSATKALSTTPLPLPTLMLFFFTGGTTSFQPCCFCNNYFTQAVKALPLSTLLLTLLLALIPCYPLSWGCVSFVRHRKVISKRDLWNRALHSEPLPSAISKLPPSRVILKGNSPFWRRGAFLVSRADGRLQSNFTATH